MISHDARLRDAKDLFYSIYARTRANHARFSSVQVRFCGSWMHSLLNYHLGKQPTGRKGRAYDTISNEISPKITPFKTTLVQSLFSRS